MAPRRLSPVGPQPCGKSPLCSHTVVLISRRVQAKSGTSGVGDRMFFKAGEFSVICFPSYSDWGYVFDLSSIV